MRRLVFFCHHTRQLTVCSMLGCIFLLFHFSTTIAQEVPASDTAITAYQNNRQTFIMEQQNASQVYKTELDKEQQEIGDLKKTITSQEQELEGIESLMMDTQHKMRNLARTRLVVSSALFPMLALFSSIQSELFGSYALGFTIGFLVLTIINVFIFIKLKEEAFFNRRRSLLITIMIVLIISIASPLLADDQVKRVEIINKLNAAERMLSRSDYERFIAILEEQPRQEITIPNLDSGNTLFKVYHQVQINSPEYWYTLAALYTHEGQNGKAMNAVKKITESRALKATPDHQEIIVNCIRYLLQAGQMLVVGDVVEKLSVTMVDVSTLLEIAELLKQNGMQASAERILGFAIMKADDVKDLVSLSQYFRDHGESDKSNEALDRALHKVNTINEIKLLIDMAISLHKDVLIGSVLKKLDKVTNDYREKMALADMLLQHQRKEDAVNLISQLIRANVDRKRENIDRLLYLIDASLKRNLLPQATEATETLIILLGIDEAKETVMREPSSLDSFRGLPDEDKIMLPEFYGLINEEQGFNDKAEDAYIQSVLDSLATIIDSYGYTFPESMNDFYLLGRLWVKGNKGDLIDQLDRVYTVIEREYIKKQAALHEEKLKSLREEIDTLNKQSKDALESITEAKHNQSRVRRQYIAQWFSTIGTTIFIILVFAGCTIISLRHSRRQSMAKSFGFVVKFIESHGWLQVLSILGIPTGFISIVTAQFFLIFQQIQENNFKSLNEQPRKDAKPLTSESVTKPSQSSSSATPTLASNT